MHSERTTAHDEYLEHDQLEGENNEKETLYQLYPHIEQVLLLEDKPM